MKKKNLHKMIEQTYNKLSSFLLAFCEPSLLCFISLFCAKGGNEQKSEKEQRGHVDEFSSVSIKFDFERRSLISNYLSASYKSNGCILNKLSGCLHLKAQSSIYNITLHKLEKNSRQRTGKIQEKGFDKTLRKNTKPLLRRIVD